MVTGAPAAVERVRELVAAVPDPELPMLTIGDLGILRNVEVRSAAPDDAEERNNVAGEPQENRDAAGPSSRLVPDQAGGAAGTPGSGDADGGVPGPGARDVSGREGGAGGTQGPGDEAGGGSGVVVALTPTYSGCPALEVMRRDVRGRLADAGFGDVVIRTVLDPPWSSDWITPEGRRKLAEAGIAPPGAATRRTAGPVPVTLSRRPPDVSCPRCGSGDTVEMSAFGSTACKSLRRCRACAEPFEHVKEI